MYIFDDNIEDCTCQYTINFLTRKYIRLSLIHIFIDFHTHLGDIFQENKNIAFKRPGIVPHEDGFDPFKDLEESGFTRPLIVPDQKAQNVLIDAGQYRIWDRDNKMCIRDRP